MSSSDVAATGGTPAAAPSRTATAVKYISWSALAFMTVGSVASLRPAATMATYGLAAAFLYILPAIVFLLPTALVSAELASGWSGGVYRWVTDGISPNAGLIAIWGQFAMTIFYYPTLLSYVASTLAYVFNPDLAASGVYTAAVIVVVYWLGVFVALRGGIGMIARLAQSGLIAGTLLPAGLLVVLGVIFLAQGNQSAAPMGVSYILPPWAGIASLVLIVSNFMAYTGMEMNAVHVNELRKPETEFPRGMFVAIGLVLLILVLPPIAISWFVPADQLSLTAGAMQAFDAVFAHFGLDWLTPIIGLCIVVASLAGFLTWLSGPSKGLLLIGREKGFLPPFFQRTTESGAPVNILVIQGLVTTGIALLFVFLPSVSSGYWIFSVITTQTYLLVYFFIFVAAMLLRRKAPDHKRGYRAPILGVLCVVGFASSLAAFLIGFVPPSQFGGGSPTVYAVFILIGTAIIGGVIPGLLIWLRKPSWQQGPAAAAEAPEPKPAPRELAG
ncbi:MAG TPA: APC family permease [Candidatus Dormibacteraeota bacterium]